MHLSGECSHHRNEQLFTSKVFCIFNVGRKLGLASIGPALVCCQMFAGSWVNAINVEQQSWWSPSDTSVQQQEKVYLTQNTIWWIEYADLSGLRVDTWSYSAMIRFDQADRKVLSE